MQSQSLPESPGEDGIISNSFAVVLITLNLKFLNTQVTVDELVCCTHFTLIVNQIYYYLPQRLSLGYKQKRWTDISYHIYENYPPIFTDILAHILRVFLEFQCYPTPLGSASLFIFKYVLMWHRFATCHSLEFKILL